MKKEYLLILPTLIIAFGAYIIAYNYDESVHFRLRDYFIDTAENHRTVFMFIEANKYDSVAIWNNSINVLSKHKLIDSNSSQILVAYYYSNTDKYYLPENIKAGLKRRFPLKEGIESKFDYFPNGYIFTGTNSKTKLLLRNRLMESQSLIKAPVTKPKPQFKAKNILKN